MFVYGSLVALYWFLMLLLPLLRLVSESERLFPFDADGRLAYYFLSQKRNGQAHSNGGSAAFTFKAA